VLFSILLALLGLGLLTVAADHLVLGAGRLATRLRVAPVVVGVVVIGLGTSAPEFLVSGLAAAAGDVDLAAGNLVGSNVLNLTLILGAAAIVSPIVVRSTVVRREAPLSVAAVGLFAGMALLGLGAVTGAVLAVAGVVALLLLVRLAWQAADRELPDDVTEFLDDQPQPVPQVIVGFTLVAVGTSLPELVTAIQAQRRGESDLLVGNLFGSNLFNALIGGAVVGFAAGNTDARGVGGADPGRDGDGQPAGLGVTVSWISISRSEAAVLLAAYLLALPLLA
jgi:cation:H+ antiporter